MTTVVRDLMSSPAITCGADCSLAEAARTMAEEKIGSVVVTEDTKVIGILTERDLLRAAAAGGDPRTEPTRLWMTSSPDVLGPDEEVGAAWSSLTHHHYRHLPVVEGFTLLGVVSLRDLMRVARLRPATESGVEVPRGLEGVIVAETSVGDVRGREGFFHYRQYSAVDLASKRSFEDVWRLVLDGSLPDITESDVSESDVTEADAPESDVPESDVPESDVPESGDFSRVVRGLRPIPPGLAEILPALARRGSILEVLRTSVSLLGSELGWKPTHDIDAQALRSQALQLGSVVPTILAAASRLRDGREPMGPRSDLGHAANYLWMLNGTEPSDEHARAMEQYMILTVDHGFNASTFAARVIVSTGADLAAAACGAIGALSGPLHGGAPSRVLDMLDEIATPERAERWLRGAIERGDRIMGFGHRVYRTEDPRSDFLRGVAANQGGPLFDLAVKTEKTVIELLAELKPERELGTNVEFYAGVVMDGCGMAREMFTPTFAAARTIGWTAHVLEQAADNRLIRPAARYVGLVAPKPVPMAG